MRGRLLRARSARAHLLLGVRVEARRKEQGLGCEVAHLIDRAAASRFAASAAWGCSLRYRGVQPPLQRVHGPWHAVAHRRQQLRRPRLAERIGAGARRQRAAEYLQARCDWVSGLGLYLQMAVWSGLQKGRASAVGLCSRRLLADGRYYYPSLEHLKTASSLWATCFVLCNCCSCSCC